MLVPQAPGARIARLRAWTHDARLALAPFGARRGRAVWIAVRPGSPHGPHHVGRRALAPLDRACGCTTLRAVRRAARSRRPGRCAARSPPAPHLVVVVFSGRAPDVAAGGAGGEGETGGDLGRRRADSGEVDGTGAARAGQVDAAAAEIVGDLQHGSLGLEQADQWMVGVAREMGRLRDVDLAPAPGNRHPDRGRAACDLLDLLQHAGEVDAVVPNGSAPCSYPSRAPAPLHTRRGPVLLMVFALRHAAATSAPTGELIHRATRTHRGGPPRGRGGA